MSRNCTYFSRGIVRSSSVLCLQYQVFPIQQPVQQQHTEEPTYEVVDGPCTTHSGQLLRLPTFQLMEGEHPFLFLSRCHSSLWSLLLSLPYQWQVLSLCAQSHLTAVTLPHFHSMLNQPTGMLQDMCLCTDSGEMTVNLALCCGVTD